MSIHGQSCDLTYFDNVAMNFCILWLRVTCLIREMDTTPP